MLAGSDEQKCVICRITEKKVSHPQTFTRKRLVLQICVTLRLYEFVTCSHQQRAAEYRRHQDAVSSLCWFLKNRNWPCEDSSRKFLGEEELLIHDNMPVKHNFCSYKCIICSDIIRNMCLPYDFLRTNYFKNSGGIYLSAFV